MRVRSLSVSIFFRGKVEEIIGFVLFTTKSKCWRIFEKRPPISLEEGGSVIIAEGDTKETTQ